MSAAVSRSGAAPAAPLVAGVDELAAAAAPLVDAGEDELAAVELRVGAAWAPSRFEDAVVAVDLPRRTQSRKACRCRWKAPHSSAQ